MSSLVEPAAWALQLCCVRLSVAVTKHPEVLWLLHTLSFVGNLSLSVSLPSSVLSIVNSLSREFTLCLVCSLLLSREFPHTLILSLSLRAAVGVETVLFCATALGRRAGSLLGASTLGPHTVGGRSSMWTIAQALCIVVAAVAGVSQASTYSFSQSLESPAGISVGASARCTWKLCSDQSLQPLFASGAVLQSFVNKSVLGASLRPWSFSSAGTCASGEFTIPIAHSGPASIDLAVLSAALPLPSYGMPYPQSVLASASPTVVVTASGSPQWGMVGSSGDNSTTVGMFWEPWFTPLNFGHWPWAEALPSLSTYMSSQAGSARQHGLWLVSAGMAAVGIDWTNNLWNCNTFACRNPNVWELMNDTQLALGVWQGLREEGVPAPPALMLMGLDNGPVASMQAIEQQLQWTQAAILDNVTAGGAASTLHDPVTGRPLVVLFDGSLANHTATPTIGDWGVRWMGSQLQSRPSAATELGYWSWMDGVEAAVISPLPPAERGPSNEQGSVTISSAFFASGGWLASTALGKRGGATLLESAVDVHARVGRRGGSGSLNLRYLWVNQWNEFAGQANGGGYGPDKSDYVDIYSAELGNDMEPTDLRSCGYRRPGVACGGYGWRQLNLLRFVAAWAREQAVAANETVLAVSSPPVGFALNGSASLSLGVLWARFDEAGAPALPGAGTAGPPAGAITVEEVEQGTGKAAPLRAVRNAGRAMQAANSTATVVTVAAPTVCTQDATAMALVRVCTPAFTTAQPLRLREDDAAYPPVAARQGACVEHAVACGMD